MNGELEAKIRPRAHEWCRSRHAACVWRSLLPRIMAMPEPTTETPPRQSSKPGDNVVRLRRDPDPAQRDRTLCEAILESASDYAIITIDLDGRITSWNAGARNLLGWVEAEALGMDGRLLFTPEDRALGRAEGQEGPAPGSGPGGGRALAPAPGRQPLLGLGPDDAP